MESLRIRIPERYQPGIAKLISLPDNALEELLPILHETPNSLNLDYIKEDIASKVSFISEADIEDIISTLDSLYYIKNESHISAETLSEQILQGMAETGNKALQIDPDLREPLRDRFIKFLSGRLFSIVAKAREALYEQERAFGSAQVLSDIRVVFARNEENHPDTAVIVHTLKIHYIQNDQHKEFFVSLDTEDISILIDALIRAQGKEEPLKTILAAANVPYVDAE